MSNAAWWRALALHCLKAFGLGLALGGALIAFL